MVALFFLDNLKWNAFTQSLLIHRVADSAEPFAPYVFAVLNSLNSLVQFLGVDMCKEC